jgi:photosystem II stability/assembly factor-like uncharacterized protein
VAIVAWTGGAKRTRPDFSRKSRLPAARPRRSRRLELEELESRTLLSGNGPLDQLSWTSLGPAPILNGQTAGQQPVSGRIAAIAADPRDAATIYLAAAGGGVWKTTDAGNSWTPLTDDQATLFMGAIALAPSNPDVIYAGTGEATNSALSFTGHGVLKSTDAGQSWTLLGTDVFDRRTISQIVVAPDDPDTVYVAVGGAGVHGLAGNTGIWRSTDGGATWTDTTAAISTTASFTDVEIDPTNSQTLYAAVGSFRGSSANGVYKSTDGGTTWAIAGNFPVRASDGRMTIAVAPSDPQTLFVSVSGSGQGGSAFGHLVEMLKSTDGGSTWTDLTNLPDLGGNGWYGLPLAVDPSDVNTLYASAGGNEIVESNNGGATWFSLVVGADGNGPHPDHHAFAFDANGHLLDGNDGGIWRLDNPQFTQEHWTDLNTNLQLTQYIGIAVDPADPTIAYGGSQDNGTSKFTGSAAWTLVALGDGGFVRIDPTHPSTVYHEFFNIDLERSDDGGLTWVQKTTGINHSDPSNTYIPYVMDPGNSQRLVLGTNRVYETTNRGDLWRPISQPSQGGWNTSANVDSLAIAASDANTIYASAGGHLFVTFDDGVTWQQRDVPGVTDHFQDIQIDPADRLTAFAVRDRFGGGHVFMTTDGGQTWTDISGNLPDLPAYTLARDPSTQVLYVGMDDGVYVSTDQGGDWSRLGTGLPHAQVKELELLPGLHLLAAGTHGRGVWELSTEVQTAPPTVDSVVINDGSAQRSMVTSLTVTFSTVVSLDAGAFELDREGGGTFSLVVSEAVVDGHSVDTITFVGADIIGGSLADGHYTLTIHGDHVHDLSGLALDGAGTGTAGSDRTDTFFRLFGDADGDGHVDLRDLLLIASTLGKRAGDPGFLAYFDYNGDGRVDGRDMIQLLRRFGQ